MSEIEKIIKDCKKCGSLPKLTCNTMKIGNSRILVLGESPAKDGWIQSGRAFYNKEGKFQASGKVLDRLLNIIELTIDDINFTEVCKCIIQDRKKLRECSFNCLRRRNYYYCYLDCGISFKTFCQRLQGE